MESTGEGQSPPLITRQEAGIKQEFSTSQTSRGPVERESQRAGKNPEEAVMSQVEEGLRSAVKEAEGVGGKEAPSSELDPAFQQNFYRFRKKIVNLLGASFDIYDDKDTKVLFSRQDWLTLKDKFHIYKDKSKSRELLDIKTKQFLDIHGKFDVSDPKTGDNIGAIKREWLPSILRDKWTFLSPDEKPIGMLQETSQKRAILSRIFGRFVPAHYTITDTEGEVVADVKQRFNPFVLKYDMHIRKIPPTIDRRLLVTSGILLSGVEARIDAPHPSSHTTSPSVPPLSSR